MRLVYLDENFCDAGGHNAAYALAIQGECTRRKHSCTVYANSRVDASFLAASDIVPAFDIKSSALHQLAFGRNLGRLGQLMRLMLNNVSHCRNLLQRVKITKDCSLVLIGGNSPRVTFAYLVWFGYLSVLGVRTKIVFILHDRVPWFAGIELRLLRLVGFRQQIFIAAQSQGIADDFRNRFKETIVALPTPQADLPPVPLVAAANRQRHGRPINLAYLGLASSAKGFGFLVEAITSPEIMQDFAGEVRFTVQYNPVAGDEAAVMAGQRLLGMAEQCDMFTVLPGSLAKDTFETELERADAMLLPYNPEKYSSVIQSGIVTQAIAAAKPLIVSAESNLEREMHSYGAGISFRYGSVTAFSAALRHLLGHLDVFSTEAMQRSATYRQIHGPAAYVTELEKMAARNP